MKEAKNMLCCSNSNDSIWVLLLFASLAISALVSYCHGGVIPITGVLPISLDDATNLYMVKVEQGDATKYLTLDLSNSNLWTTKCNKSTRVSCNSTVCAMSATCNAYVCGGVSCTNNDTTCSVFVTDSFLAETWSADLWQGNLSLPQMGTTKPFLVPDFPFGCTAAVGDGVFGLSRGQIAAPQLLSRHIGIPPIFSYCLSGQYEHEQSPLIFGGPEDHQSLNYSFLYSQILADAFHFTPFLTSKHAPDEYFVQINSIYVGDFLLPINMSLLSIDEQSGRGGTRITTSERYTRLEPTIYHAISQAFVEKAAVPYNLFQVAAVPPFQTCFDSSRAVGDRVGILVPSIVFGFSNANASGIEAIWEMDVLNSIVNVNPVSSNYTSIRCLAFLETKPEEKTSIVIGTFQQQHRLMRFDLKANEFGFTRNILRSDRTLCSSFNFTAPS